MGKKPLKNNYNIIFIIDKYLSYIVKTLKLIITIFCIKYINKFI